MAEDPSFGSFPPIIAEPMVTMQKFFQQVGFEYHWLLGDGDGEFGIHDMDFWATFAFPFFYNPDTPLLVTPGFGLHLWSGPSGPGAPDMPPRQIKATHSSNKVFFMFPSCS